mgnify:CR=1 FL=1
MTVDYGPNGWVSYDDGYPLQITLTLGFKETDIVTKDNINPSFGVQITESDVSNYDKMTPEQQVQYDISRESSK